MVVKKNQLGLYRKIRTLLEPPVVSRVALRKAVEREVGHGRIERRELVCSEVLAGRSRFPGLVQIYRLERERVEKKTGKREVEVEYGISSLSGEEAGPEALLRLRRGNGRSRTNPTGCGT
jgi:hypothetical protein